MHKIKQKISFFLALLIFCIFIYTLSSIPVKAVETALNFEPSSTSVYMVYYNESSEQDNVVVYKQNEDQRLEPASLTKIMTAIITLEELKDQDLDTLMVTAPNYIFDELYGQDVSTADIRQGEEISIKDLLYAMMLQSACEASNIIAHYIGGEDPETAISNFVEKMNDKAEEIGVKNTNFVNAHGLEAQDQYTTAYDMYLITKYALENVDHFEEITTTTSYEMAPTNIHTESRMVYHTNYMLDQNLGGEQYYYEGAKGIKTGTLDSGRNLISMADRNGSRYLLITLGAPYHYADDTIISDNLSFIDAKCFYDWAFNSFELTSLLTSDNTIGEIQVNYAWNKKSTLVKPKSNVVALLPKDLDLSQIKTEVELEESIDAPVAEATTVGKVYLKLNGETLG